MSFPIFFNNVPVITMADPLADILGAASGGIMEYSYADAVKLAGHSCPTVAGAYRMLQQGLALLYPESFPVRGEIRVTIKGKLGDGVVGVIANVASMITGATESSGFHGLGGRFDRRNLLYFDEGLEGDMVLERIDTDRSVCLSYNPKIVSAHPQMQEWLGMILSGKGDMKTREAFQSAWQDRVKRILIDHRDDGVIKLKMLEEGRII